MTRARREALEDVPPPRSTARCYLVFGMIGSLAAVLLGLVFEQQAVFAAGLACFGMFCLQGLCGHCSRIVLHNAVVDIPDRPDRPLERPTL
jgi:hypothetical protein